VAIDKLQTCLITAVESQITDLQDETVGVFLSGGLDSAIVAALLVRAGVKVRAYTLDFGAVGIPESPYAEQVAEYLKIPLVKVDATPKQINKALIPTIKALDLPFGDGVTVPLYLLNGISARSLCPNSADPTPGLAQNCLRSNSDTFPHPPIATSFLDAQGGTKYPAPIDKSGCCSRLTGAIAIWRSSIGSMDISSIRLTLSPRSLREIYPQTGGGRLAPTRNYLATKARDGCAFNSVVFKSMVEIDWAVVKSRDTGSRGILAIELSC
jgi:hypothetical protein